MCSKMSRAHLTLSTECMGTNAIFLCDSLKRSDFSLNLSFFLSVVEACHQISLISGFNANCARPLNRLAVSWVRKGLGLGGVPLIHHRLRDSSQEGCTLALLTPLRNDPPAPAQSKPGSALKYPPLGRPCGFRSHCFFVLTSTIRQFQLVCTYKYVHRKLNRYSNLFIFFLLIELFVKPPDPSPATSS